MAEQVEKAATAPSAVDAEAARIEEELGFQALDVMNLSELLAELRRVEEAAAPVEDLQAITARIEAKVDGIKLKITQEVAEAQRLKAIADEFNAAARAARNRAERLEDWVRICMVSAGHSRLNGSKFAVAVDEVPGAVKIEGDVEPTAQLALRHPQWIERTYSWKKAEMRAALINGTTEGLPAFVSLGKTNKLSITVRRKK